MPLISASRRTDIPAFYGQWFENRLRAGHCLVANPFRPDQVRRVSLAPEDVDGFVFWTRRPGPFLDRLEILRDYPFYFQVTLNAMDPLLEPHLPPEEECCGQLAELALRIGPERVVWRFDPLMVTGITPAVEILARFRRLCGRLAPHARRVVVSRAQLYAKVRRRLGKLDGLGLVDLWEEPALAEDLLGGLALIARNHGLEVRICADSEDYTHLGIGPGRCVDPEILNSALGLELKYEPDPGQRKACGCARSIDIGAYNSCVHGCLYCYANHSQEAALRGRSRHDPGGETLIPRPGRGPGNRSGSDRAEPLGYTGP